MKDKKVLIAVNFIGFVHFLWKDIDYYNSKGFSIYVSGDNRKNEEETLSLLEEKKCHFIDIRIDSKTPVSKKNWEALKKYREVVNKENFDVVHCHTPIVGFLVRLAARKIRKRKAKVIYTSHGLAYSHLSTKMEFLKFHTIEWLASRWSDAIITINKEDYNNAKKLCCKKVFHINGIGLDIDLYKQALSPREVIDYKKELGLPQDKLIIGAIGELSPRKNHNVIIKAIGMLPNKNDYVFAIRGRALTEDDYAANMQKLALELGVDLRLLGFKKDIPLFIYCVDIGVIPSKREGLGMAGLQQLCAGVPIIGTDVQGIKEYCIDGVTGAIVKNPSDIKGFAKAIQKLSDTQYRAKMKKSCQDIVKQFGMDQSIRQRQEIYSEILGD